MADAAGIPWSSVVHLRRCIGAILSTAARWSVDPDDEDTDEDLSASILNPVLLAVLPALIEPGEVEEGGTAPEEEEVRVALQDLPAGYRRRLLGLATCWAGEAMAAAPVADLPAPRSTASTRMGS
jgi:hypothetical protein